MGKLDYNVLVHGLRGKVGNLLVFRIVGGKTIVAKKPLLNRVSSESQITQQECGYPRFVRGLFFVKKIPDHTTSKKPPQNTRRHNITDFIPENTPTHLFISLNN